MKKVFHLSSCSTCKRVLSELELGAVELQDIKFQPISERELDIAAEKTGSYESLFNKRAIKYREQRLNERELDEADYRRLMLEEYTFLKRPLFILEDRVFAGSSESVVEDVKKALSP